MVRCSENNGASCAYSFCPHPIKGTGKPARGFMLSLLHPMTVVCIIHSVVPKRLKVLFLSEVFLAGRARVSYLSDRQSISIAK